MPDLTGQSGEAAELGAYDFLSASKTCNFSTAAGVVSFTGSNAFKHAYSLLQITLTDSEEATTLLTSASITGEGRFTNYAYRFTEEGTGDVPVIPYLHLTYASDSEGDFAETGTPEEHTFNMLGTDENGYAYLSFYAGFPREELPLAKDILRAAGIQLANRLYHRSSCPIKSPDFHPRGLPRLIRGCWHQPGS